MTDETDNIVAGEDEIFDPFNIDSADFNHDLYLNKLVKESRLTDLMDHEQEVYQQIQSLDSEMQRLVYENYNKFIAATDTIRKMKTDFRKMEIEMDSLSQSMANITDFSSKISKTLSGRKKEISRLSSSHDLLRKLQLLFELPPSLKECLEQKQYSNAVRYYLRGKQVLQQYCHLPSFQGIEVDCDAIVAELREKLREEFRKGSGDPVQVSEYVQLLQQLDEPMDQLAEQYLLLAKESMQTDLNLLERQLKLLRGEFVETATFEVAKGSEHFLMTPVDVLEFIDLGCNNFLGNLSLIIASYAELFVNRRSVLYDERHEQVDMAIIAQRRKFVEDMTAKYFDLVEQRVAAEKGCDDSVMLVRALDRFYRRLQALTNLMPDLDVTQNAYHIVTQASQDCCDSALSALRRFLLDRTVSVRHALTQGVVSLTELLATLESNILEQVRTTLTNLQCFIRSDITFSSRRQFKESFCKDHVREGVVVTFVRHINKHLNDMCKQHSDRGHGGVTPPGLLLLLSRFSLDLKSSLITQMLRMVDEEFGIEELGVALTPASQLSQQAGETAQELINHFVRVQGLIFSQMLRKSVETRDWLKTIEPRNVRAVMKRVVEDVTALDAQVGCLYEEGSRRERSSDSSRRTYPYSAAQRAGSVSRWGSSYGTSVDNSLLSNIQKLFSEKIEIFSPVHFSKVSIMSGVIKISLKTLLECVRLRTFGRFGLQQMQVDTHYLQLYLWRFVSDENLVHVLLDEIMTSTLHRCLDPVLMEPSVVEVICDRG